MSNYYPHSFITVLGFYTQRIGDNVRTMHSKIYHTLKVIFVLRIFQVVQDPLLVVVIMTTSMALFIMPTTLTQMLEAEPD